MIPIVDYKEIGYATLLYTPHFSRAATVSTVCAVTGLGLPKMDQGGD
jgi:hypothetical protein